MTAQIDSVVVTWAPVASCELDRIRVVLDRRAS